jgi:hypothetical protein
VLPAVLPTAAGATFDGRVDAPVFEDMEFKVLTLSLHGQYIASAGMGAYFSLPFAHGLKAGDDYVGNLELGGLYVARRDTIHGYLRVGATLEQTTYGASISLPLATALSRPADAATTGLGTSWLRAGGGVQMTHGSLVAGSSGGIAFAADSRPDREPILHLSGSVGIARPRFGCVVGTTLVANGLMGVGGISLQAVGDVRVGGWGRVYAAPSLQFDKSAMFSLGVGLRAGM